MAQRIVFTDSGFWKYFWAHLVMSMTESCRWVMQCHLRDRRPRASNKGLLPCPLRTEISPVSLNLLMMLCTVDDEICKAFLIWCWGTLFVKYSTIFLRTLSQIGEPLPIFTSDKVYPKVDESVKFLCLNICYVLYVLLWIKYRLMWFESLLVFIL